jgi:hypothetical protein
MRNEAVDVEKMLHDSTFYMPVSNEEKAAVYAAMTHDFRGTGHWYYCENGHPFTIGGVVCRWRPLNAHNVVLRLVVMIIGLLVASDLRRIWSVNSVDLEFDLDCEGRFG